MGTQMQMPQLQVIGQVDLTEECIRLGTAAKAKLLQVGASTYIQHFHFAKIHAEFHQFHISTEVQVHKIIGSHNQRVQAREEFHPTQILNFLSGGGNIGSFKQCNIAAGFAQTQCIHPNDEVRI